MIKVKHTFKRFFLKISFFTIQTVHFSIIRPVMKPALHAPPHQHYTCNQSTDVPCGCCSNNDAWLHFWTSSLERCVTPVLHMWACLASFGRWDCQACRNHGFNYKYCWCPIFQVNKQQSAYSAGFSSVLIRLVKFKSLRWELSPIILFRVCFCVQFQSRRD